MAVAPNKAITSFGQLLGFAVDAENKAVDFCRMCMKRGVSSELFAELARRHVARVKVLERAKRQNLSEMILEPIEGISASDYSLTLDPSTVQDAEGQTQSLLAALASFEEELGRFYLDAVEKADRVLAEVSRFFKKYGKESCTNAQQLLDMERH